MSILHFSNKEPSLDVANENSGSPSDLVSSGVVSRGQSQTSTEGIFVIYTVIKE